MVVVDDANASMNPKYVVPDVNELDILPRFSMTTLRHVRSDVAVGAETWTQGYVHVEIVAQARLDVAVGAAL